MDGKKMRLTIVVVLAAGLTGILAACGGGGVDQEEYDAVADQLTAEEARAQALQQQLAEEQRRTEELEQQIAAFEEWKATHLVVLATEPRDPPEPRPTPTPLPAGQEPPPPPQPPATYFEPVDSFIFVVETLTASGAVGDEERGYWGYTRGCAQSNYFARGTKMVWRVEVIDPVTGKRVLPDDAKLVVRLPNGEEKTMRFSQRGGGRVEGAPWMWSASWEIPPDYPVGTLDYEIVVQHNDGRVGSYRVPYSGVQVQIVSDEDQEA
ncbi:MAG: hypothetical protein Kow0010_16720 [Dehalococcoidia bacterium]